MSICGRQTKLPGTASQSPGPCVLAHVPKQRGVWQCGLSTQQLSWGSSLTNTFPPGPEREEQTQLQGSQWPSQCANGEACGM